MAEAEVERRRVLGSNLLRERERMWRARARAEEGRTGTMAAERYMQAMERADENDVMASQLEELGL